MSGWLEHTKKGIWSMVFLGVALVLAAIYSGIAYINQDVFGYFIILKIPIPILMLGFLLGMYATLLPDLDMGNSKVYHGTVITLLAIVIIFVAMGLYYWETIAILLFLLCLHFLNHRGLLHEWWFGGFVALAFGYIFGQSITVCLFVLTGYYVHLWWDD